MSTVTKTSRLIDNWFDRNDQQRFLARVSSEVEPGTDLLTDPDQGVLSFGLPSRQFRNTSKSEKCLFWFPYGTPAGWSTLIASSRIGNRPDTKASLFDAMRTLACRFNSGRQFLIAHDGMSTSQYVFRTAHLYDLPLIEFKPMPEDTRSEWFQNELNATDSTNVCYYSHLNENRDLQVDDFMVNLATDVRLLSVSSKGNCYRAALRRLNYNPEKTWLLVDDQLTAAKTRESLLEAGAVPWWLYREHDEEPLSQQDRRPGETHSLTEFMREHPLDSFLAHWTRRRQGPWPDQGNDQFIDDLILGLPSSDHSRAAALCRIIANRRLTASNKITRDNTPVVCFTEKTIDRFRELRTFRPHLSRWDFELVGLAIKRTVLAELGARPVIYGSDENWRQIEAQDRPFFQIESSRSTSGEIQWNMEKEWRIVGDIDLGRIKSSEAFVFVETADEAEAIAPLSRWPVVIIGEDSR